MIAELYLLFISLDWDVISKIKTQLALVALALLLIFYIVRNLRNQKPKLLAVVVIPVFVIVSMVIWAYSDIKKYEVEKNAIYRVRVTVLGPNRLPLDGAKVISFLGGESKGVDGGKEINIPASSVPKDRKLKITASAKNDTLHGYEEVDLEGEYNLATTITLEQDPFPRVRGRVTDDNGNAVTQAHVYIEGYLQEATYTDQNGYFELPGHVPLHEHVRIYLEKPGYTSANYWQPSGEETLALVISTAKR